MVTKNDMPRYLAEVRWANWLAFCYKVSLKSRNALAELDYLKMWRAAAKQVKFYYW